MLEFLRLTLGRPPSLPAPAEATAPSPTDEKKASPEDAWSDREVKASEKLLDFAKADYDRISQEIRTADDRARGNATLAAASVPVMIFLRADSGLTWANSPLIVGAAVLGLVGTLVCTVLVVMNRGTSRVDDEWLLNKREEVYRDGGTYMGMLYTLQGLWAKAISDANRVRDSKYNVLEKQIVALGLNLLAVVLMFIDFATRTLA